MKVIGVEWGSWYQLECEGKSYFIILCQCGRGENELSIEWNTYFQQLTEEQGLTQEQMLDHISNNYSTFKELQVDKHLADEIDRSIQAYGHNTKRGIDEQNRA